MASTSTILQGANAQVLRNGATTLPQLGDGAELSLRDERQLGDRIARELYRDPDYVDDPALVEYVQGIWQPLLAAAKARGEVSADMAEAYAWEVLLGKDRSVNAFALPGAYLGLHLGLVAVVTSRDELASVLAHELSHVSQRHIARMMARQSQQAPWLLGAMILGMLAASKANSSANAANAANAVIVGGQALGAQAQLNFSRDMEREADRVGFSVATEAGFAPQGFVSMFAKLQQASRLNDGGQFPYLRSHPLSTEREADMQARIELALPIAPAPGRRLNQPEMDHALMAARARVLAFSGADSWRKWAQDLAAPGFARLPVVQQAATLYGACLASMRLRDYPSAQTHCAALMTRTQGDAAATRLVRLLHIELLLAQGAPMAALQALREHFPETAPPSSGLPARAVLFLQAQTAIDLATQGRQGASEDRLAPLSALLRSYVAEHPRDALAWQWLARVLSTQGRTLPAMRAQAEMALAQQDTAAALERFKGAQDWARREGTSDHIEASIIDTRVRALELAMREQSLQR